MSRENQQGLWGELWTLREVVAPSVGVFAAMRAWRGPLGADQDIQLPNAALEVKTSTAHAFERLVIASERQLEVASDIPLALIALSLDARPDHGETLAKMVREVRVIANDAGCLSVLEGRLALVGYSSEDDDSYSDIGYSIRSRLQLRVQDEFPRIVSANLRSGIGDVRYSVAVAACAPFEISDRELIGLLRGEI